MYKWTRWIGTAAQTTAMNSSHHYLSMTPHTHVTGDSNHLAYANAIEDPLLIQPPLQKTTLQKSDIREGLESHDQVTSNNSSTYRQVACEGSRAA